MKLPYTLLMLLLVGGQLLAQPAPLPKDVPQIQITFDVTTDDGKRVQDVDVTASTFIRWERGEGFGKDIYHDINGKTNEDGLATIYVASQRGNIRYGIYDIPGYYSTRNLEYQFKEAKDGRWQPWNPTIDVVLKPIINPIAMYARRVGDLPRALELPQKGAPVGFDLMVGDWVAPYGKGTVADLIFTLKETVPFTSAKKPFDATLTVTFSNRGDGIQSAFAAPFRDSDLRLPRYAPEGGYQPTLSKQFGRPAEGKPIKSGIREDQNYFVRVRTVLDKDYKIKSALYGKIFGDISCDLVNSRTGFIQFTYCLNPTPNDRNMEFDPKRNLFGNLPSSEAITDP